MLIGIPREPDPAQAVVSATPDTVTKLIRLGYEVQVQSGAGDRAAFPDQQYAQAGAAVVGDEVWDADVLITLDVPPQELRERIRPGRVLISRMAPGRHPELVEELESRAITGLAVDAVPRISRAQSMDVLSSMANIAGYRAVIEAAGVFGRLFTGQVTAAGKIPPAEVYVIGAGVAGLAAIGTANSMGAVVRATDLRPEVAEQVASMGAEFVPIPAAAERSEDGYAKEMTAEQAAAAARLYTEQSAATDIVITTANIPGRAAPRLLTAQDVAGMRPGSVIVDMAAASGGNCELTVPGEVITTDGGVTIVGHTDLAGRLPAQASQLYGQNIVNLLTLMTPEKDGMLQIDLDDEIIRGITVTRARIDREGERPRVVADVLWPPPPVQVSAAPATGATGANANAHAAGAAAGSGDAAQMGADDPEADAASGNRLGRGVWAALGVLLGAGLILASPLAVAGQYVVLLLAVVVGFYVITAVTHALHTPLMSETNAVSGIILVGAILQVGSSNWAVSALAFLAIVVASINIFGGFTVTHRMLGMFRRDA
ncbi:Re/Si-specific NAD(P)(+) transhydrogenase subunit alpha [Brachybacterium timonense]|uniref:Re/Si-specific NAD(P)(+) transhydrogenase subunit alpha n=1 Tax=Brachybacterium timonense TaxID=2050896 RepID=UPI000D0B0285|nr:Re/Si-specific NAD(P)(+) transhydrogenase subunit alpha [Brachybacterium timonense]